MISDKTRDAANNHHLRGMLPWGIHSLRVRGVACHQSTAVEQHTRPKGGVASQLHLQHVLLAYIYNCGY